MPGRPTGMPVGGIRANELVVALKNPVVDAARHRSLQPISQHSGLVRKQERAGSLQLRDHLKLGLRPIALERVVDAIGNDVDRDSRLVEPGSERRGHVELLGIGLRVAQPAIVFSVGQQDECPVTFHAFQVLGGLKHGTHHGGLVPRPDRARAG